MALPISLGQAGLALPHSMVTGGAYPNFDGVHGIPNSMATDGFIIHTLFNPERVQELTPASGKLMPIVLQRATYAITKHLYGPDNGDGFFALPNLQGASVLYLTDGDRTNIGQFQGNPSNTVTLSEQQLPASLGGQFAAIDNLQYGLGMQNLIQTEGQFPSGSQPDLYTVGMVYPFAGSENGGERMSGFMPADGRLLSTKDYSLLFAIIGNAYGGDGIKTFALPDLRNRVPVGAGVTADGLCISAGQKLGQAQLTLASSNLPGAGDEAFSTMQPSLGMNYVITTKGYFESFDGEHPMIGQIALFAGTYAPMKWTLAQGQMLNVSDNPALFALVGNKFGGDGRSTFALPDLRGRTVVGTGGPLDLKICQLVGGFEQTIGLEYLPEIIVPMPGLQLVIDDADIDESVTADLVADDLLFADLVWHDVVNQFKLDKTGLWTEASV